MIDEKDETHPRKRPGAASDDRPPADGEDIEILEVSAADEAGVPLEAPSSTGASADAERLRAQVGELREQLLRTAADFDNFRKRTERDRIEERKQAAAGVVRGLLPVLDSFSRALSQADALKDTPALAGFVDGVKLIESQLFDILKAAGLEAIETEGRFDPIHHEALMQEPSPTVPHLSILEVYEPGYRLGGRLLRPARVKVAYNPESEAGPQDASDDSKAEAEGTRSASGGSTDAGDGDAGDARDSGEHGGSAEGH
jgi:molecular chaperone GrpE